MDDPLDSRSTGEDPKKRSTKEIVERKRGGSAAEARRKRGGKDLRRWEESARCRPGEDRRLKSHPEGGRNSAIGSGGEGDLRPGW
ncbi:hypothetical protein ACFY41_12445 [Streptomyces syringium]|uniref:hypothetical protein n=1 Tax=Streptomyces syringium TaxID=76729 RepID=UPI0036AC43E0